MPEDSFVAGSPSVRVRRVALYDAEGNQIGSVTAEYNATPPTVVDGDTTPLQTDSHGNLLTAQVDENGNRVQWNVASPVYPAVPVTPWYYAAAAGGILNTTTAVRIVDVAGVSMRNYLTSISVTSEIIGAATEIAIRDGAGGTVLWRSKIGTAGWINGREINFGVPLRSTANTLLEVVTLTASITGAVYFNAQGFQAA